MCRQQGFRTLPSSQFESPVRRGCQANDYRCSGRGDGGHLSRKGCRRREYRSRSRMRAAFSGLSAAAQRSFAPPCEVSVACGRYKGDPPRDPHASRLFRSFGGGSATALPCDVSVAGAVGRASPRPACEPPFQVFRRRLSGASPSYRVWPVGGRASLPAGMRAAFSGLSAAAQRSFALLPCEVSVAGAVQGRASRRGACEPTFQAFRRRLSGASPSYGVCQAAEKRR